MEKVNITIIGAGIIGLSVAAEVSRSTGHVCVLERNESFGMGISSRNSEVIHAGIYYPKDSLKTKTCIEGNRLIYETCIKNNIAHKKTGKFIVATETSEIPGLEKLFDNAGANGVEKIELLPERKAKQLEPHIRAKTALYSKTTGIVDSHSLMKYYAFKAQQNKASIAYKTEVKNIIKTNGGYEVTVIDSNNEEFSFLTEVLINCAGLDSDTIAEMAGIDIKKQDYRLKYCKGQYFNIAAKKGKLINRLIYPVPTNKEGGLSIHATPNLTGIVRLGPDDEYIDRKNVDYIVDENAKTKFYNSASRFLPFLEVGDLTPDISGIRPKLQGPGEPFRDFLVKDESNLGFPGFINLVGIESPGLTAAPSIAKFVSSLIL